MIAAIDTNLMLDILSPHEAFYDASAEAFQIKCADGSLVIGDIAYAELWCTSRIKGVRRFFGRA